MAKLNFKDFIAVDYMPGQPDLIKKNAKKRKGETDGSPSNVYSSTNPPRTDEQTDVDEALSMSQRLARSRQMKRYKSRIAMGRKRQARKIADDKRLIKRARKAARNAIAKKFTQDIPKSELTFARRQEIEKRLDKMSGRIDKLAKRMLPKLRKAELAKKRG